MTPRAQLVIWAASQEPPLFKARDIAERIGIDANELSDLWSDNPRRSYLTVKAKILKATEIDWDGPSPPFRSRLASP